MIDTIKFYVDITPDNYSKMLRQSVEFSKYRYRDEALLYRFIKTDQNIGSYSSSINICILSQKRATFELSIPKFALGHNCFLIYPTEITQIMNELLRCLNKDFITEFPHYSKWIIGRLDVCYAWKYKDEFTAKRVMKMLQKLDYPRKTKYIYNTESVMWKGDYYSPKFYLKYEEFYKHDFKKLKNSEKMDQFMLSYQMLEIAKGILRFEVTMRKQYLDSIFKHDVYIDDITQTFCENKINTVIDTLFSNMDKSIITIEEAYNKLTQVYGTTKGFRLWLIYKYFNDNGKDELKLKYKSNQAYQNLLEIKKAGVSITNEDLIGFDFNLKCPSEYCINNFPISEGGSLASYLHNQTQNHLPPSNTGGESE